MGPKIPLPIESSRALVAVCSYSDGPRILQSGNFTPFRWTLGIDASCTPVESRNRYNMTLIPRQTQEVLSQFPLEARIVRVTPSIIHIGDVPYGSNRTVVLDVALDNITGRPGYYREGFNLTFTDDVGGLRQESLPGVDFRVTTIANPLDLTLATRKIMDRAILTGAEVHLNMRSGAPVSNAYIEECTQNNMYPFEGGGQVGSGVTDQNGTVIIPAQQPSPGYSLYVEYSLNPDYDCVGQSPATESFISAGVAATPAPTYPFSRLASLLL